MTAATLASPTETNARRSQPIVMLGASSARVCGVRDYSRRLSEALADLGVPTVDVWWEIDPEAGLVERRRGMLAWLQRLRDAVEHEPECVVVWQYSVFTYGTRGVPTFVPRIASCLAEMPVLRIGVLHELAYPFRRRGLRGAVHASTQRLALARLFGVLDAAVVTTQARKTWLNTRVWLPRRPTAFLPVCSSLPKGTGQVFRSTNAPVIGVFGFAAERYGAIPVLGAVSRLRRRGIPVTLRLIGAPGPHSPRADLWRAAAVDAGCSDALSFTGVLELQTLARVLHDVDVLVLPDIDGPSGRKSTLAASLAVGKPVVAFDGPDSWEALVRERAVAITRPGAGAIADLLERLLRDASARAAQGARGRAFYASRQAPEVIAAGLLTFLESVPKAASQ